MDDFFPLPLFSDQELVEERSRVIDGYCNQFATKEHMLDVFSVKISFSSILIDTRTRLWGTVISLIEKDGFVSQIKVLSTLRSMISMSLFV